MNACILVTRIHTNTLSAMEQDLHIFTPISAFTEHAYMPFIYIQRTNIFDSIRILFGV